MVFGSIYGAARIAVSEGAFNPDYATPTAALDMVTEGLETDQKFFNLLVEHDFLEAGAVDDVTLESTLMAVNENFLGDAWSKIVELIKKIKDKVASIFKAAAVKIGAFFTKDNAALVSRYDKQFQAASLSDITIKGFRMIKDGKDPLNFVKDYKPDSDFSEVTSKSDVKDLEKYKKNYTVAKQLRDFIGKRSDVSDSGKIDFKDIIFESAKDKKVDTAFASMIKTTLTNHQDSIGAIETERSALLETLDSMEKKAAEMENTAKGIEIKDNNEETIKSKDLLTKKADVARTVCTVTQSCIGKLASAGLDAIKFNIKQCRAAFIKIATSGSARTESAELLEAMLDADDYEVDSFFDQYSYDYNELTA